MGIKTKLTKSVASILCPSTILLILSELSANSIQYISPSSEQYVDQLRSYDVPEQMIQGASNLCVGIAQAEFDFPSNDLQNILGRKLETVKEFLKVTYGL